MAQGILGVLPAGLRGYVAGEQMQNQRGANQLQQMHGILGLQGMLEQRAAAQQQQQSLQELIPQLTDPAARMMAQAGDIRGAIGRQFPQQRGPVVVGPGGSLVDPTNPQKPLYTAPFKPAEPQESTLAKLTREMNTLPPDSPLRSHYQDAITKLTTHAPAARQVTNVLPPQKTFENENKLRDDYTAASKPFVGIRDAYNTIQAALGGPITAVSTLAGATKFMKMIDPESVVRESELNMALKATGMLDRFMNLHNTVMKGQVLTPNQAAEIKTIAETLYQASAKQQAKTDQYFGGLADSYGLNRQRVIRNQASAMKDPGRRKEDVFEAADAILGGQ
jgi:hypothetical protein